MSQMFIFGPSNVNYTARACCGFKRETFFVCPACGRNREKELVVESTKIAQMPQKKWPDILGCSMTLVNAVSDRVLDDMRKANITGFDAFRLNLEKIPPTKPKPFDYWLIMPSCTIPYEPVLLPEHEGRVCKVCGMWSRYVPENNDMRIPDLLKPEGFDEKIDWGTAFSGDFEFVLCSERIVDLALAKKWTNCSFHIFGNIDLWNIPVRYNVSNWRELLEQDIARYEAELRGNKPKTDEAIQVVIPEMPKLDEPSSPKPASDHPFDNLSVFDGTAWQGNAVLPCAFGLCDFVVYEDDDAEFNVDDNADYLPTKNQRKLFDFFASHQEALLSLLRDALIKTLRQNKILDDANALSNETGFPPLSQWLDGGSPEFKNAKRGGSGIATLCYTVKEADQIIVITVEVACNPAKNSIKIKSCEI